MRIRIPINEGLIVEARAQMRATQAADLRKTNPTVGRDPGSFDLDDRNFEQQAKL